MRVLVLGASGMLGNAMLRVMCEKEEWSVFGTVRGKGVINKFPDSYAGIIVTGVDVSKTENMEESILEIMPDVIINCIGITKHIRSSDDPLFVIPINSILPHRLAKISSSINSRVIHISTDCVFSGEKGSYSEDDFADARDLYGLSKYLGELHAPNTITLRTSIIGHEFSANNGLIEWFLSQEKTCKGYTKAIFSGLPTVELAMIIRDLVIPDTSLSGLYHVAGRAISKFDLLNIVADVYKKPIKIIPDDELIIDRSLNSDSFNSVTNYSPPEWVELIKKMHKYH